MSDTIIYFFRHAERFKIDGNINVNDSDQIKNEKIILSINGEKLAKEISELKELSNIDILYSSHYVRAMQTAKYISEKNNIPLKVDERLGERKLGSLECLKYLGLTKNNTLSKKQLLDENLKNVDGESKIEVNKRMLEFLNEVLIKHNGMKIAIVTHGAALKFLFSNWCLINDNTELTYNNKELEFTSPSIFKLTFDKDKLINLEQIW